MKWARACTGWLRRALGLPERRSFADLLDDAMHEPFVSFSARALEQAMLLEGPLPGCTDNEFNENPNPGQSANAGAQR